MSDAAASANAPGTRERPHSVSSLTGELKALIEGRFSRVYVEAEISGWRRYPSGHCYFTLKDDGAQISAVMFASSFARCKDAAALKDGAKVIVYANATVYPPRGNYQLVVLAAKLSGEGDLMRRYMELKARLEAEGLFDPSRKKPLPTMPRRIAIVTSEAGAVIHDMCTVLTRRFPNLEIRLYPSLVQGAEAPRTIIAGIEHFNSPQPDGWTPDLLIVARGGGSFEDLFCFNDEALVRAVAASKVPTISAVGHETDFTLCDFAADRRAGTPSIAAEMAVPVLSDLTVRIGQLDGKLSSSLRSRWELTVQRVDHLGASLGSALTLAHGNACRRVDALSPRLDTALRLSMQSLSARVEKAEAKLAAYSPYGVLERGYTITTSADGTVVRDPGTLKSGDEMRTMFRAGSVRSTVV